MVWSRTALLVGALAIVAVLACAGTALAHTIERVSVGSDGAESNSVTWHCAISGDGRYVAFSTRASDLVPRDTNGFEDVFVRDLKFGTTVRVSLATDGAQGNGESSVRAISADGRYVVFQSDATNLVPGDTNGKTDVFVRDMQSESIERVSLTATGGQANGSSLPRAISDDGRFVVFGSDATNLVAGDTNGMSDVFVRDRVARTTERVSVSNSGTQGNRNSWDCSMSANGRYVVFQSEATNLVPGDTNGKDDIFIRDRATSVTSRVSVKSGGGQANASSYWPRVSDDGRYVAFSSDASNLVPGDKNGARDAFVHDCQTGATLLVSVSSAGVKGDRASGFRSMSGDGRYVAFVSYADNLVSGDSNTSEDVFVRDLKTGTTQRVNVTGGGLQVAGTGVFNAELSADGVHVAFDSDAAGLVPADANSQYDVFVAGPIGTGAFCDISFSPYESAIGTLANAGIVGGYSDGAFRPDNLVARKHFAKMIVGAMGLPVTEADWQDANSPFSDLGPDDPASLYPHDFVAVAKAHGLTAGKTATNFAPDANITRAQMVTMVVRAAQNSGMNLKAVGADYAGPFKGYDDPTHGGNVHLADYNGLLQGLVTTGDPLSWMAGNATRGEVAQVLWNLMQKKGD